MSKSIPPIMKYMSSMPHTIEPSESLLAAQNMMREFRIRHLPVRSGTKLVGIISDKDIDLVSSFQEVDLKKSMVKNAMTLDPYIVDVETPLNEVCMHMAEAKIGSALVQQSNGTLVGIFTDTDALRTLSEIFETRLKK